MSMLVALIIAGVSMVVVAIMAFVASRQLKSFSVKVQSESIDREAMRKKFGQIEAMLDASSEMARKVAVAEVDKLMEHVLKMYKISGETQLDRLQEVARSSRDLRDVIVARERIITKAKAPAARLSESEAGEVIRVYKKGFRALGIL